MVGTTESGHSCLDATVLEIITLVLVKLVFCKRKSYYRFKSGESIGLRFGHPRTSSQHQSYESDMEYDINRLVYVVKLLRNGRIQCFYILSRGKRNWLIICI